MLSALKLYLFQLLIRTYKITLSADMNYITSNEFIKVWLLKSSSLGKSHLISIVG